MYQAIHVDGAFDLEVWYGTRHGLDGDLDVDFHTKVKWDIPVLEGYNYSFLKNYSWKPGIYNGFWGVVNLDIWKKIRKLPLKSIIIIHGWFPFSSFFAIICSKILCNITCLRAETPLNHELERSKLSLTFRKIFFKYFLFRFIDNFLYIGSQNKKFYQYYGVCESNLIFTPYAVNNDYFQRMAVELIPIKEKLRENIGINPKHKVILFSGKLINKKRPLDLLAAYINLENKENTTLIFMGEGLLRNELESRIKELNLKNVIITGFINQSKISEYYAITDVYVMCSDIGETWGLSTNEAMNFGLPVIISDMTGNYSDLVDKNGIIFKTGNIEQLADAIRKILSLSPEDIQRMRNQSLNIIKNYCYSTIIEALSSSVNAEK